MKTKILFTDFQPQPSTSTWSGSKKEKKKKFPKFVKSYSSDEENEKKDHESDTTDEMIDEGERTITK